MIRNINKIVFGFVLLISLSSVAFASTIDDVLLSAVANNNIELAKTAIAQGANVNYSKPSSDTPLTLAVKKRNAIMITYLLNSGADPNKKMDTISYLDTPLIRAVINDDLKSAQLLVQGGADINMPREMKDNRPLKSHLFSDGATPLILAIEKEFFDSPSLPMVQFLIAKGADVNLSNAYGYTPLMASAKWKMGVKTVAVARCQIAIELLKAGADPASRDDSGKTALQYAADTNFNSMLTVLLPVSPK